MECSVKEFILSSYIKDTTVCDQIIELHQKSKNKIDGTIGNSKGQIVVDYNVKKCTQTSLDSYAEQYLNYTSQLQQVVLQYIEHFKFVNEVAKWRIVEQINVQHYKPGEAFSVWHSERISSHKSNRILVFMTYLNDVNDQGETEFYYQNYKVKPKKGLTLIWPAEWTHTHRGVASPTEEKYIVTGWFNYCQN